MSGCNSLGWGVRSGSALFALVFMVSVSMAQMPDNLMVVVPNYIATGGPAVGAFGYDPTTDTLWVAGYGGSAWIRKVTNVTGAQAFEEMVSPSEWVRFTKTNPSFSGGSPICGSLLLNPLTIFDTDGVTPLYPPYTQAWIIDANSVIGDLSSTKRPDLTKRVYRYNLQVPADFDASTVMTPLVTLQQMADVIGLDPPSTTSDVGRQFAWSSDGQSLYFNDGSSSYGGIWKVRVATGALTRIFAADAASSGPPPYVAIECEPCVLHTSVRDLDPDNPAVGDQILFRGSSASGNVGGLDYLVDTGTSVLGPYALFTEAELERFIQWNGRYLARPANPDETDPGVDVDKVVSISSITTLGGDIYFFETTGGAVWRLDGQGRLAVVMSKAQRVQYNTVLGASNVLQTTMLRLQFFRQAPYATITVPQFLFQDAASNRLVGGLLAFKTGDFNRDNNVDEADLALFKNMIITPIRTFYDAAKKTYYESPSDANGNDLIGDGPAYVEYLKYDLNGNGLVTARDRVMLWKFMYPGKSPCDFDLDGDVDQEDFGYLQACITGPGIALSDADCYFGLLDEDGDIDEDDVSLFATCLSGPAVPASADCLD
jgi:hypothetical protein